MAELNFNSSTVEPQQSFDPIPKGWYNFMIEEVELKPTKAGTGSYLSLRLKVQEGEFANRVVFDMITYSNPNAQAVEIGHRKLSALCRALGIVELTSTDLLENRIVAGKVGVRIDKTGEYDPQNDIREYKASTEATTAVGGQSQATASTTKKVGAGAGTSMKGSATATAPGTDGGEAAPWEE
ncbi:hypothetical protein [Escherichia phage vB_EcoM_PiR]|uniref:DUF669 domain-containing protein n=1 Tax=Escherichia phage JEP7 TaxID=2772056 RepID=A0A7S6HT74_9CAUD|nr:hypothetical protein JEP7_41 [Escherichia phage JEP7]UNY42505.1 hypothetical protein [Escherichia phage vB_EcoM_PiR]